MTKDLIKKAFEKTGLYPVNRQIFTADDFAPSRASSVIAHVPGSFPADFPSSDPAEASGNDAWPGSDSDDSDFTPSDEDEATSIPESSAQPESSNNTDNNPEDTQPVSGIMDTLASLETKVAHMTRSATARLDVFTAAPLKIVSLHEDKLKSREELLTELRSMRQQLVTTHQALGHAIGQLSASNAHCTAIQRELGSVREKLNNATKAKERGSKKIKARFVTSRALRSEFEQEEAERQEREQVAAEKEKQKEVDDAEQTRQIAEDALNRNFTGRLAAYKKNDLRALSIALSVSDKGTNAELLSRIQSCFEQNPDLKRNSRFYGLFNKSIRERKNPTHNEEAQEQATQGVIGGPPGDGRTGGNSKIARSILPHHPHPPHPPNMIASSSSSSYMTPTNHYIYQYPMPSFEAPVLHPPPQPTSYMVPQVYNPNTHTYYNNLT
ncbi:hypothetical protein EDB85DRAFT_2211933 [Lactarius pseudohatsudake]|nr:hypothetical protein EDB85DRAFT_2211933 [Lactarius pseudohatsudake]